MQQIRRDDKSVFLVGSTPLNCGGTKRQVVVGDQRDGGSDHVLRRVICRQVLGVLGILWQRGEGGDPTGMGRMAGCTAWWGGGGSGTRCQQIHVLVGMGVPAILKEGLDVWEHWGVGLAWEVVSSDLVFFCAQWRNGGVDFC